MRLLSGGSDSWGVVIDIKKWSTTFEFVVAMADWIDNFYNTDRVHSHIGNISPD